MAKLHVDHITIELPYHRRTIVHYTSELIEYNLSRGRCSQAGQVNVQVILSKTIIKATNDDSLNLISDTVTK